MSSSEPDFPETFAAWRPNTTPRHIQNPMTWLSSSSQSDEAPRMSSRPLLSSPSSHRPEHALEYDELPTVLHLPSGSGRPEHAHEYDGLPTVLHLPTGSEGLEHAQEYEKLPALTVVHLPTGPDRPENAQEYEASTVPQLPRASSELSSAPSSLSPATPPPSQTHPPSKRLPALQTNSGRVPTAFRDITTATKETLYKLGPATLGLRGRTSDTKFFMEVGRIRLHGDIQDASIELDDIKELLQVWKTSSTSVSKAQIPKITRVLLQALKVTIHNKALRHVIGQVYLFAHKLRSGSPPSDDAQCPDCGITILKYDVHHGTYHSLIRHAAEHHQIRECLLHCPVCNIFIYRWEDAWEHHHHLPDPVAPSFNVLMKKAREKGHLLAFHAIVDGGGHTYNILVSEHGTITAYNEDFLCLIFGTPPKRDCAGYDPTDVIRRFTWEYGIRMRSKITPRTAETLIADFQEPEPFTALLEVMKNAVAGNREPLPLICYSCAYTVSRTIKVLTHHLSHGRHGLNRADWGSQVHECRSCTTLFVGAELWEEHLSLH